MEIAPVKIRTLRPPQDNLLDAIKESSLVLEEHDVIAISSKVVSIWQGRCVPIGEVDADELVRKESDQYLERSETPGGFVMHTITNGMLAANAGIDPFAGYRVLWPENPIQTAEELLTWFKKEYKLDNLYLVLTDSRSMPLRRGVVGTAIAWAGFAPLYDNRARKDLLGYGSAGSQTNIPDSLAAAAVFSMGEANEGTPVVRIRNAPYVKESVINKEKNFNTFTFGIEEDIFAPFLKNAPWKKGGKG